MHCVIKAHFRTAWLFRIAAHCGHDAEGCDMHDAVKSPRANIGELAQINYEPLPAGQCRLQVASKGTRRSSVRFCNTFVC